MLPYAGSGKKAGRNRLPKQLGLPTDPFPTLLASDVTPFAFWYEGDPDGGCIRFLTETESERLMGLPEGWTKYGADGEEIRPLQRYKALGNAIALLAPITSWPGFMKCWQTGSERRIEPMFEAYITNTALYPHDGD